MGNKMPFLFLLCVDLAGMNLHEILFSFSGGVCCLIMISLVELNGIICPGPRFQETLPLFLETFLYSCLYPPLEKPFHNIAP